jgi:hypothetical protein
MATGGAIPGECHALIATVDRAPIYTCLEMLSNSHGPETPPSTPVIDCSRLLCSAIVDNTEPFSGRTCYL